MTRKRFSADTLAQQAHKVRIEDLASPPTREVSLIDVVRTMAIHIQARRDAGHSFSRISEWLNVFGYEITAATLCVYWHRITADRTDATPGGARGPPPARAASLPAFERPAAVFSDVITPEQASTSPEPSGGRHTRLRREA